jgi:dolichyl-phosphate beta-glucosyltransferase
MSERRPTDSANREEPTLDVTVIVPAYNEVRGIAGAIREIQEYFAGRGHSYEIIVSADGNDGTRETAREIAAADANVIVIGHTERRGKGRGIREAMQLARGRIVGFVDADRKTPIDEFGKLAFELDNGFDVAIGSRALAGSTIETPQPLYRRIGSRGFSVFMRLVVGLTSIRDTQCGFKFFRRQAGLDLFARQRIDGYMFDVEILHLAQRSGYRIAQVPVRWRNDGDSRLQLLAGNARNVLDIFRIRFGRAARVTSADARSQSTRSAGS